MTQATMMFLDCPASLDQDGAVRCGLPAEVRCRFTMRSTGGTLESAMIRCPAGHCFNGPLESLTPERTDKHTLRSAAGAPGARHGTPRGTHDGHGSGGPARHPGFPRQSAAGGFPAEHRSCLLSGPACPPVDHRHAPAPQPHRIQSSGGTATGADLTIASVAWPRRRLARAVSETLAARTSTTPWRISHAARTPISHCL